MAGFVAVGAVGRSRRNYSTTCARRRRSVVVALSEFDVEAGSDSFDMRVLRERIRELEEKKRAREAAAADVKNNQALAGSGLWVILSEGRRGDESYLTMKVNDYDTVLGFERRGDAGRCAQLIGLSAGTGVPTVVRRPMDALEDYCHVRGCQLGIVPEGSVRIESSYDPDVQDIVAEVEGFIDSDTESARQSLEDLFNRS
mmetsp:Transcript_13208/g.40610  ORF Transcript_13208/g.40610 Transcript_13208/m.40610 type:complete len:200 (+) Transcript_13208:95-694(+)|eukprot:CAMPEP_0198725474 /NCGR_PEP_ID=MMETSP1475-20131203/2783_1 /TAXON_ID= ORGANISM="Unidentified sp., Strain CCMP1999" /NCGR_SAMPLE_ID=MMETSP1475 /ASSEMBLY_ACC=CAM_ASM_001111 /LENGTH=199 /DNA_ID=CAMNT_0044487261 /DNA_START=60 /DNA_END=659 /DNA_ORIENTATION=+